MRGYFNTPQNENFEFMLYGIHVIWNERRSDYSCVMSLIVQDNF
jgi:hypothetical protein